MNIKSSLKPYATPQLLRIYHTGQAILANLLYRFPGRRLRVIGVTGTNGKTTTAHLIGAITAAAGYKTAIASTVAFQIGDQKETNALNMTTPNPFIIQRFRARLRFFPIWQQSLAVGGLLVNDRIVASAIRIFLGDGAPPLAFWLSPLSGLLIWPWLFLVLDMARMRGRQNP